LRSLSTSGDCCWLLFDLRFFAREAEQICCQHGQPLRLTNVGSAKQIDLRPPATCA